MLDHERQQLQQMIHEHATDCSVKMTAEEIKAIVTDIQRRLFIGNGVPAIVPMVQKHDEWLIEMRKDAKDSRDEWVKGWRGLLFVLLAVVATAILTTAVSRVTESRASNQSTQKQSNP